MKSTIAMAAAVTLSVLAGCWTMPEAKKPKQTYSSFDLPSEHPAKEGASRRSYEAQDLPLGDVLKRYEQISGRTVIAGNLPAVKIRFRSATPLTRIEALQMLDTALALKGIAMVLSGDKAVKAVTADRVRVESPPEITLPWRLLPESSSVMSRTVQLQNIRPSATVPVLRPLAGLPDSILPIEEPPILLLRDYSSNIRQQLKLLEELDKKQP